MIIQHPDGSYESCPLPPTVMLWLRGLLRSGRALAAAIRQSLTSRWAPLGAGGCPCCDGGLRS